jgi:glutathione S-transferase
MTQSTDAEYELYYWPGIQGRGEFIRLALEEAGASYADIARQPQASGGGTRALVDLLGDPTLVVPPFAPPMLKHGDVIIAQTANILFYLGSRLGLAPADETARLAVNQHQLTLADLVVEAHDAHHPIGVSLYYEEQKQEALRRAELFLSERMPKFLGYFERVLSRHGAVGHAFLVGDELSYADLSLAQVLWGLKYAFPRAFAAYEPNIPRARALRDAIAARPRIHAYLMSPRRIPFNEEGIFRHYTELDR